MKKNIRNLIALQAIDIKIRKLDKKIAEGDAMLGGQQAIIDEKKADIVSLEEKIAAGESRNRELEAETADEDVRIKDRQAKLMNVQTNREYQSLLREIEDAKKANNAREEEIVLLMEQAEAHQNTIAEEQAKCEEEESELATAGEEMAQQAKELDEEKLKITEKREAKAKMISQALLKKYERLRENRKGVAVVGATNAVCQGCFMNIPPQLFNELLREQELLACPTCNRMLYHKAAKATKAAK